MVEGERWLAKRHPKKLSLRELLPDTAIGYNLKQEKGKYHQKQAAMGLKSKSMHFKLEETSIAKSSRTYPTMGPRGKFIISWSRTQLTQLELFAGLAWILSDPASVNRPRIDH